MLYAIAMGQINSKYTNNKYGIIKKWQCGIIYTGEEGTQSCPVPGAESEKYYWTGGHRSNQGSDFVWKLRHPDEEQITDKNWNEGEPNGASEQCISMKSNDYTWEDHSCTRSFCYLCEIKIGV